MQIDEGSLERLREIGLFGGLSDETLRLHCEQRAPLTCEEGQRIYREGESGRVMYVILEGRVEMIRRDKRGNEGVARLLSAGQWFGEKSILDVQARPTSARTAERSLLLPISAQDLDVLYRRDLKGYALLVLNLAREMSRQLRSYEAQVFELLRA